MRVRALRSCFVGGYRKAGDEFEYSGPRNRNLEPVKQAKPEAVKEEAKAEK